MKRCAGRIGCVAVLMAVGWTSTAHALWWGTYGAWDTQARKDAADAAMQAVVNRFNIYGDFNWGSDGWVDVYYNSGVPTAQANYYGAITFGGTWPNERVSQHELNHWLGSGTYWNWGNMFTNNLWTGAKVNALIQQFDGDGTVFNRSGVHFYGYGLNYDSEVVNDSILMRNVAIMYAMRQDMGNGNPNNPWSATSVTLTASDPIGTSAFNWFGGGYSGTYGGWSDRYFAHPGAAYSTGEYTLRTPLDTYNPTAATPSFTFAGDSLTINNTNGINGGLLYKGVGTTGVLTINNLILSGGYVRHASSAADLFQLAGNITLIGNPTIDAAQGSIRILAPISGSGSLTLRGGFIKTLTAASTYSGGTTLVTGTLLLEHGNALGTGPVTLTAGRFGTNLALTIPNAINVTGTPSLGHTAQTTDITLTGALTGSGTLANAMGMSASSNVYFRGDLSGFTGTLSYTCDAGSATQWWRFGTNGSTVDLSKAAVVINKGNVTNTNAFSKNFGFTDNITGATMKIGALSGDGIFQASYNSTGPNTLEVGHRNTSTTFSGVLAGGGAGTQLNVVKVGTGTWTLSGTSLYTGSTTISAGALRVTGNIAASSGITVNAGGTLEGTGNVPAVTLKPGGQIEPGPGQATLRAASLTWSSNGLDSIGVFDLSTTNGTSDLIQLSGPLMKGPGSDGVLFLFDFAGGKLGETYTLISFPAGQTNFTSSDFSISSESFNNGIMGLITVDADSVNFTYGTMVVPEPAGVGLMFGGAMALLTSRRNRRRG